MSFNKLIIDPLLLQNSVELEQRTLSQYRNDIDYRLQFYETVSSMIVTDQELNSMLHEEYEGYLEATLAYVKYFDSFMAQYTKLNSNFLELCIYSDNPTLPTDGRNIRPQDGSFLSTGIYEKLLANGTGQYIFIDSSGNINYYRIMNSRQTAYRYPVLYCKINRSELLSAIDADELSELYIFDQDGRPLVLSGTGNYTEKILETASQTPGRERSGNFSLDDDIVIYETTQLNWLIAKVIEPTIFFNNAISQRNMIHLLWVCSDIILILILLLISGLITRRIHLLMHKIDVIRNGNYDAIAPIEGRDEIGQAGTAMDELSAELKYLIEKVYQADLANTRLELDMLYAQINPHFLYNSLSAIDWFLHENNAAASQQLVHSLIQFYRFSLGRGSEIVPLSDEIAHLKMYLSIEERLTDSIHTEILIPDEMGSIQINRMTLQPLVENAINHASKGKNFTLHITVSAAFDDDAVVIRIADDGICIPRATAREFNLYHKLSHTNGSGIGLANVHSRIRLHFGEPYGVSILESDGPGTTVLIRLPV